MAKFYGQIGFERTVDKGEGVYETIFEERDYYGDLTQNRRRWSSVENTTNDNVVLVNNVSIVADEFAYENLGAMRYICFKGTRWGLDSIELAYPRINLTFGGVYNG